MITLEGGPQRGLQLGRLGVIERGGIVCEGKNILAVGRNDDMLERYPDAERIDLQGRAVVPGFVDPHTHLIWAGDRASEFEMRLQGKTYMEIMAAGGGSPPPRGCCFWLGHYHH